MRGQILSRLGPDPRVVLIRLRSLGDTVLATPAFALLRRAVPDARIHVAMEDRFAGLLDRHPDLDSVLRIRRRSGLAGKARLLRAIRAKRPSLCIDMHGGSTAAWLTGLSGARWRAGFAHFRQSWAYNVRIPRAQQVLGRHPHAKVHTAEHHAATVMHLGAGHCEIPRARLAAGRAGEPDPYAVIHAGAAYATKTWAAGSFRAVARDLRERHRLAPVLVAGPGEGALALRFADLDVRLGLPLPALVSLIAGARVFVGNDSGPAHVAAAFGVPCVVIFGSSDSSAWHPWRTAHRVVETDWDCKPCPGDRCYAFDEPRCILSVEASAVRAAVSELLAESEAAS